MGHRLVYLGNDQYQCSKCGKEVKKDGIIAFLSIPCVEEEIIHEINLILKRVAKIEGDMQVNKDKIANLEAR